MAKKLFLELILAQIWAPNFFFCNFYLYVLLDIAANYHRIKFKGILMNQT